ncbi:FAD-dependent oxidoreductase [Candidatus Pelagibacter bacterium]|nr:FAD-dependent oxidoreductase [Candidatus Pelagibacter bacterium]
MSTLPKKAKVVIIGGGIHGLSTAWKLSETYKNDNDIVVLEKKDIAAGASGIACGVVRNNYFQPAMRELMAHSVSVWESDPKAFKYNSVGYLQISPEVMHEDVASIAKQQKAIGYDSEFIEGEADCMKYMKNMFGDWQAQGITSVLHEKKGGYAFNKDSIKALEEKSTSNGVKVVKGVTVTGFKRGSNSKAVTGVETDKGIIECDQVVVGAGPWVRDFWNMLELPKTANIKDKDGKFHETEMWKYWMLQEGVIGVDADFLKMDNGGQPPVIHVDSTAPLYSDKTKKLITDKIWGIYYKPDIEGLGVQGGTSPYIVDKHFDKVNVDPYGIESPEFQTTEAFNDMWCSALAHCQKRFEGKSDLYRKGPSGGLGCMTPDSFPIFDKFLENVYMIADANHGYKMIGVGELVAKEILGTEKLKKIISTDYYSTEVSDDLTGIELSGAIKNIYSMLIGASEGLSNSKAPKEIQSKYYLNTSASLIHRSISEMVEFVSFYGGRPETVYGLAGLGDLYVSAIGGRNSLMGKYLGEGYLYKEAKEKFMKNITVEGAQLALEIGPKILQDLNSKHFPLMFSMLNTICDNKKLEIQW